jgi:NitT/TauT family transport system substrate-binding protein
MTAGEFHPRRVGTAGGELTGSWWATATTSTKYPVATKRVLRAILKGVDPCAAEPERAARRIVDGGFTPRYDYARAALSEVPYEGWRDYDPEDTMRFLFPANA